MPSFMENLLGQAQTIKEKGMFFFPIETDHKAPTVATSDVAAVAAEFLIDSTWTRQADVPVLGPEDISPNEMAAILSKSWAVPFAFSRRRSKRSRARWPASAFRKPSHRAYADMMTAKNEGIDNTASRRSRRRLPLPFASGARLFSSLLSWPRRDATCLPPGEQVAS